MDDGAAGLPVGDLQGGGAAVLHLDLIGLAVQLIALGRFQLRHLIPALFRFGQGNDAGAVGGVGADDLPVELADFKLDAADTLPGFLVLFDDGQTAHLRVIHGDGLRVGGVHLDRLRLGGLVHDVTGQGLGFRDDQRTHHAGNADFAVGVGLIQALAGQVAVVVVQIAPVRVGDLELHPGQRLPGLLVQLLHHDAALLLIVKAEGLSFIPTRKCPQTTQPDPIIRKKQGATRPLLLLSKPNAPQGMTATAIPTETSCQVLPEPSAGDCHGAEPTTDPALLHPPTSTQLPAVAGHRTFIFRTAPL